MKQLRIAIAGLGFMGSGHAEYLNRGDVTNAKLTAVCDINPERLNWARNNLSDDIKLFSDYNDLLLSKCMDGVIISVPHYYHPPMAIKAFEHGYNVLTEKPAGVYTKQVREMNEAAKKSGKVFGIMFQYRIEPVYQKLRDLVRSGEIGEIRRIIWIITNWYRSQSYYDSGTWRATWAGEGGGVLLNQCPHNLDLWQWICGLPCKVKAICEYGKHRDIEVENDVTAYMKYDNGATGVFITSTVDTPGTNRLEITGDRGKLVVENNNITFWRLRISESKFNKDYKGGFGQPECWKCEIPVKGQAHMHKEITSNWVKAIQKGTPLLSPGEEGMNGVQISNAMLLSDWTGDWVNIPVDEDLYYEHLKEKIKTSVYNKEINKKSI